jgi:hypothetical protein
VPDGSLFMVTGGLAPLGIAYNWKVEPEKVAAPDALLVNVAISVTVQ